MNRFTTLGISVLCLLAPVALAQDAPTTRVFDQIIVEGNSRFTDQDVLATSRLAPGQPITRTDLEFAVEALDFTGEFKDVAINARGDVLVISVNEQPEFSGDLTFGLGYDSDNGVIGVAGLSLTDIFTKGVDLNGEATIAEQFQTASLEITSDTVLGEGRVGGIRLTYGSYDYDNTLFGYEQISVGPFVQFQVSEQTEIELRYAYVQEDLRDVRDGASSILVAEAGQRDYSVLGASFATSGFDQATNLRWSARLSQDFAGLGTDNRFSRTEGAVKASLPIAQSGFELRTTVEFGTIRKDAGGGARATDRYTLGGAQMRGFERGGITVRDVNGAVTTSLGGETYAVARTDLVLPVFKDREGVDAFLFADVGNVWGLQDAADADGTVDVEGIWRQSTGTGVSLSTDLGRFEAYYAITAEGTDNDIEQALGLTFRVAF